jgi:hypothetical protein
MRGAFRAQFIAQIFDYIEAVLRAAVCLRQWVNLARMFA